VANDFSLETHCKALWRLENGALTTDSKSTNTLSASGSPPTADTVNFEEGAASAVYVRATPTYHYKSDAGLASGFPCKNGESNLSFTVCAWIRPAGTWTSGANWYTVSSKGGAWALWAYGEVGGAHIEFDWWDSSALQDWLELTRPLQADTWYHLAVTFDNATNTVHMRLYDTSNSTVYDDSYTSTYNSGIRATSGTFGIGYAGGDAWDGNIDEVVVFDEVLSSGDIDKVRGGTYGGVATTGERIYAGITSVVHTGALAKTEIVGVVPTWKDATARTVLAGVQVVWRETTSSFHDVVGAPGCISTLAVTDVGLFSVGSASGFTGGEYATITIKDGTGAIICARTFDAVTPFPSNGYASLGLGLSHSMANRTSVIAYVTKSGGCVIPEFWVTFVAQSDDHSEGLAGRVRDRSVS
jgi:hypothetical protein